MMLQTFGKVAKSFQIKRIKDASDVEKSIAFLKLEAAFVQRSHIAMMLGVPETVAAKLFDDLGAPLALMTITPNRSALGFTGTITQATRKLSEASADPFVMSIGNASIESVSIDLVPNGGALSCVISWEVAGDEAADVEPILGREVNVYATLQNSPQRDLFRPNEATVEVVDPETGEVLAKPTALAATVERIDRAVRKAKAKSAANKKRSAKS